MAIEFEHDGDLDAIFDLRVRIFIDEQGFSTELEEFDHHPEVIHIAAKDEGEVVGAARVFPAELEPLYADSLSAPEGAWIIGRIAVLPERRKTGLGSALIAEGERVAAEHGADEMHLHAQCRAMPFYEKNGYTAYGEIVPEEGVDHQWMRKRLS